MEIDGIEQHMVRMVTVVGDVYWAGRMADFDPADRYPERDRGYRRSTHREATVMKEALELHGRVDTATVEPA
jgi:hypothetical protein